MLINKTYASRLSVKGNPEATRDKHTKQLFNYIEPHYNLTHHHAKGYLTPIRFEQRNIA